MNGYKSIFKRWCTAKRATTRRSTGSDSDIGAEVPIETAEQDQLRRTDFSERIARLLSEINPREGRVFAIRGDWGFGKSSLKNLVIENLKKQKDGAHFVDFNPWQFGNGDIISRELFTQIADRVCKEYSESAAEGAKRLRQYGALLNGVAGPLKAVSGSTNIVSIALTNGSLIALVVAVGFELPTAAVVAAFGAGLSATILSVAKILAYLGRDRTAEPLKDIRRALKENLSQLDRPIVVFVDDIDRLEPDQIRTLLRQVKANANLPNIVFVLLFQQSIVEHALNSVAENGHGRAFLEKMVQVNFDLPAVPKSDVHNIFGSELAILVGNHITEKSGLTDVHWGNILIGCIQPRLNNLRDARRLISSCAVHLPLHVSGNMIEVNIVDFLALEVLRVFEPALLEALYQERDLLLSGKYNNSNKKEDVEQGVQELLKFTSGPYREWARGFIMDLFPIVSWALGKGIFSEQNKREWLSHKRVCSPRYFSRYFELQSSTGEISDGELLDFLNLTSDEDGLKNRVDFYQENGFLPSLVRRLGESVDTLPLENVSVLLPAMFEIGEKIASIEDIGPLNFNWAAAWQSTHHFIRRIEAEKRGDLAIDALKKSEALTLAAALIDINDPENPGNHISGNFHPILHSDTVNVMKKEWVTQIQALANKSDQIMGRNNLVYLLYHWRSYSGSLEQPKLWVANMIKSDDGFINILRKFMYKTQSHNGSDRVMKISNVFYSEVIEDYIGINLAKRRLIQIDAEVFRKNEDVLITLQNNIIYWESRNEIDNNHF
jgi:predicted KAP-like P-loop ATPase